MGLLDSYFQSPESQQGLLAASAAMLEAGGPRRMPVGLGQAFGDAMTAGNRSYQDALKQKMLREKFEQDKLMQEMQLKQMQAQQEAAQRKAAEEAKRQQMIEGMNPMQAGPVPQPQMDAFKMFQAGMLPATEYLKTMQPQPRKLMSVAPGQHVLDEADPTKPLFSAAERPPKQDIGALVIEGPDGKPMINPIALEAKRKIAEAGRSPGSGGSGGGVAAVIDAGGENQMALSKQFGKAGAGFRWKPDGSQERIPGGPADIKATAADERLAKQQAMLSGQAQGVLDTIKDAKGLVGWNTAGPAGIAAILPMTDARQLAGHIDTIKANLGFDRLQQMRDMSPTGGALGQVAVQEINYLQATIRKLDQLQRPKDILQALDKIEGHYKRWMETLGGNPAEAKPAASNQDAAALDWANKNPNDPRAAAIKAKLGVK